MDIKVGTMITQINFIIGGYDLLVTN